MNIIEKGTIASPKGFYADGVHCGIKRKKHDLGLIYSDVPATVAAVYTTNKVKAAPILVNQQTISRSGKIQAVLVNSGVANACTGSQGLANAQKTLNMIAEKLVISNDLVGIASTGVIGKQLPMHSMAAGIDLLNAFSGKPKNFHQAILTTDLTTKELTVSNVIQNKKVTVAGVAKGSGMINPNMATMLAFITTDVCIEDTLLQSTLKECVDQSFNQITVDGDTSTNDMVMVLANGQAGNLPLTVSDPDYSLFKEMLLTVTEDLAKKVARDGEGATKLIEVQVSGCGSVKSANHIAKTVVGSNLVKTAIFGEDANWGRIICAIGYADEEVEPEKIKIAIGDVDVLQAGEPCDFSNEEMAQVLKKDTVVITIDMGTGTKSGRAWGCDLTYEYVDINAAYHT
ncbi:bifunctional glutamate N-acetyltransferase/amino-acid acetyltransferase ArgJ [Vagococcus elongatus]|uniref:Arginine biosynthesis bifunctional protein ArgJ n=1 Tax=Vagococcus elongatus TaxID=180344 RepID=A0A430AZM2_9ENTE|nr:bifunctional glutamate N-acetyltransferase/amino-acid acetyltransferase ArgJ [Vagococcus elongatus]RSU13509.1 bifunctional ornithine acetyltransferase/N-acetylglutamate synthase [Vagococcus elongatus]